MNMHVKIGICDCGCGEAYILKAFVDGQEMGPNTEELSLTWESEHVYLLEGADDDEYFKDSNGDEVRSGEPDAA